MAPRTRTRSPAAQPATDEVEPAAQLLQVEVAIEAAGYEPGTTYIFRVMRSIKTPIRLSRSEEHEALGALLNQIVDQEGEDVIDTAYAV